MEENTKEKCEKCDKCDMNNKCKDIGGCHGHMHKKILKKFFFLVVLIVVFCFGVQLGELRTLSRELHQHSNFRMMQPSYGGNYGFRDINQNAPTATTPPVTTPNQ